MGGDERLRVKLRQERHHELENLLALGGVGPGTELVEHHHRAGTELFEEGADAEELHSEAALALIEPRLLEQGDHQPRRADEARRARGHEHPRLTEQLGERQ